MYDWLRQNIFYSPERIKEINEKARQTGYGSRPAPQQPAPRSSTGPQEPGGNYVVNGVTYDGKTHQAINPETDKPSAGGYSMNSDGQRTDYEPGEARVAPSAITSESTRVNPNGIVQQGVNLGDANALLGRIGLDTEVADFDSLFQSNQLPPRTDYSWDSPGEEGTWNEQTGRIEPPTAAGTVGGDQNNPQDGASVLPDLTDEDRQLSNGLSAARQRARRSFLDAPGGSMAALRAMEAANGIFVQGGKTFVNRGGELVEVQGDGKAFRTAAAEGRNPLDVVPNAFGNTQADPDDGSTEVDGEPVSAPAQDTSSETAAQTQDPAVPAQKLPGITSDDGNQAQQFAQNYIMRRRGLQ